MDINVSCNTVPPMGMVGWIVKSSFLTRTLQVLSDSSGRSEMMKGSSEVQDVKRCPGIHRHQGLLERVADTALAMDQIGGDPEPELARSAPAVALDLQAEAEVSFGSQADLVSVGYPTEQ